MKFFFLKFRKSLMIIIYRIQIKMAILFIIAILQTVWVVTTEQAS